MNYRYLAKELIYTDQINRKSVYKATELSGRFRCIKEQCFSSQSECARARGLINAQQSCTHPNVCEIYGVRVSEDQDSFLLSVEMEWADESLAQITQRKTHAKQVWTEAECVIILDHIVQALAYAERQGTSHCNITPMTIYASPQGIYKISGFGDANSSLIKATQCVLDGTPMFLSPCLRKAYILRVAGQDAKEPISDQIKSDVYSLGLTIAYLLNPVGLGQFGNESKLDSHLNSLRITEDFRSVLRDMLNPDEIKRPTFAELQGKLRKVVLTVFVEPMNALKTDSSESGSQLISMLSSLLKCSFLVSFSISIPSSILPQCAKCGSFQPASDMVSCPHFSFCSITCRASYMAVQGQADNGSCPYCTKPITDAVDPTPPSKKRRLRLIRADQAQSADPQFPEKQSSELSLNAPKLCKICGATFKLDPSATWRLELIGSRLSTESSDICSQDCLKTLRPQDPVQPVSPPDIEEQQPAPEDFDGEVPEKFSAKQKMHLMPYVSPDTTIDVLYTTQQVCSVCHERPRDVFFFFHCQKHICCRKDIQACVFRFLPALLCNCPECPLSIAKAFLGNLPLHQNDKDIGLFFFYLKCGIRREIGGVCNFDCEGDIPFPLTHSFINELQRNKCHLCGRSLVDKDWRCFFHGSEPAFACSRECVSTHFSDIQGSDTEMQCPACPSSIEGSRLALAITELSHFESYAKGYIEGSCSVCAYGKADIYLSCGHSCCNTCFQHLVTWDTKDFFPCLICGLGIHISELHPNN